MHDQDIYYRRLRTIRDAQRRWDNAAPEDDDGSEVDESKRDEMRIRREMRRRRMRDEDYD